MKDNSLKDPHKNPLKIVYEEFWVPIFGRILNLFTSYIEGQKPQEKQTYNLRENQDTK